MEDSDEDDSFVIIGTSLTPYVEGEALKKPLSLQEQEVKDNKGRVRFHGAFTGGFSAGYFNTVGSKEGFTPSTFISSKKKEKDADISQEQRPEDFMDEEDFGEHGIAPRMVSANADFTTKPGKRKVNETLGEAVLNDLIVPARTSIGLKLLCDLGWRDGQGIGARQKRISKKKASEPGVKVYGCALPQSESEDSEAEFIPDHVTFAPKDVSPVQFQPKDNVHGLGYSGIKVGAFSAQPHFSLFGERNPTRSVGRAKGIGISGQAFGVGDFEDEDDVDVYAAESMDKYDRVLGGQGHQNNYGWTAPKHKGVSSAPVGYLGQVLEGFKLSKSTLKPKKTFPPPQLPRDFRPFHNREDSGHKQGESNPDTGHRKRMDANVRKGMLGEIKSVFDLVPAADKAKLEATKDMGKTQSSSSETKRGKSRFQDDSVGLPEQSTKTPISDKGSLFKGSTNFKPFANDPEKQQRYEQYLGLTDKGKKGELDTVPLGSMTEWERSKEREEFARAARLYKPLSGMMASRFTAAKYQDNEDVVEAPADETTDKSDQKKAVEMKMFGKLTREKFEWHPDRVLCKRFNVANPYPGSTLVGLPKVKRDKYSVFNFLNQPLEQETVEEVEADPVEPEPKKTDVNIKPLAILAQEDISLQSTAPAVRRPESDQATDTQATGKQQNVEQEDEVVSVRPPMDIFKAIFSESSENEESSKEEEEDPDQSQTGDITKDNANSATDVLSSIFGEDSSLVTTVSEKDVSASGSKPTPQGNIPVQSLTERLSPTIPSSTQLSNQKKAMDSHGNLQENICGPVLPPEFSVPVGGEPLPHEVQPPGGVGIDGEVWVAATGGASSVERERKKHRKHSAKKRKSKHKKHKHKSSDRKKKKHKKPKKKKEVIVLSSTSSSDSSEDSDSDTDRRIMDRLKSIPKDKRPRASDFM